MFSQRTKGTKKKPIGFPNETPPLYSAVDMVSALRGQYAQTFLAFIDHYQLGQTARPIAKHFETFVKQYETANRHSFGVTQRATSSPQQSRQAWPHCINTLATYPAIMPNQQNSLSHIPATLSVLSPIRIILHPSNPVDHY